MSQLGLSNWILILLVSGFQQINSKVWFLSIFQDLQAEVDAHQGTYESLNSAGNQLANNMVGNDMERLHRRLEEMNQRWLSLMTKSMEIRYALF